MIELLAYRRRSFLPVLKWFAGRLPKGVNQATDALTASNQLLDQPLDFLECTLFLKTEVVTAVEIEIRTLPKSHRPTFPPCLEIPNTAGLPLFAQLRLLPYTRRMVVEQKGTFLLS